MDSLAFHGFFLRQPLLVIIRHDADGGRDHVMIRHFGPKGRFAAQVVLAHDAQL